MTVITLNETIREATRRNPASLLSLVGMYAASGHVNDIPVELLDQAVANAHNVAITKEAPVREHFESEQAYNDQTNQQIVMRALATELCYPFEADNVPAMIDEMYARMDSLQHVHEAYTSISASTRRLEEAFMSKAKTELF